MGKKYLKLNIEYSAAQGLFWMSFCIAVSFAAYYLQALGYSNSSLGLIMALGNIGGFILSPIIAAKIDELHIKATSVVPYIIAVEAASLAVLILSPHAGAATSIAFPIFISFCVIVNSLNTELFTDFDHAGISLNYGVSRGAGSLAFVLLSSFLGVLLKTRSAMILPYIALVILAGQLFVNKLLGRALPESTESHAFEKDVRRSSSLGNFIKENLWFSVILAGTAVIFFAHNTCSNFLINVVRNIGGDASSMGYLNAWIAGMEVPAMLLYNRIRRSRKTSSLLVFSFVMFALKSAFIAAAASISGIYAATVLQGLSFAVYTPAMVDYVCETIPYKDSAKGQALAFGMTTLGSIFASLFAGRLYDTCTVKTVLLIAAAACIVGSAVSIAGVIKNSRLR